MTHFAYILLLIKLFNPLFQDQAMDLLAFRDGQKDNQDLIFCAIEEATKMVFCVLGKLRRRGDYGFSTVTLLVLNPVEV
jgi:hypothetical protein